MERMRITVEADLDEEFLEGAGLRTPAEILSKISITPRDALNALCIMAATPLIMFKTENVQLFKEIYPIENEAGSETMQAACRDAAIAYVDGSYNVNNKAYGYGVLLYNRDEPEDSWEFSGCGNQYPESRNVSGEVDGAMRAVKEAIALGFKSIVICYDYAGIEMWATGRWKCNKEMTKKYRDTMLEYGKQIKISFDKVAAHTGVAGNEHVDKLAKKAVGLL